MSSTITPAELAALPPAYLAENVSGPLFNISIAFLVLETIFMVLFVASRYMNKTAHGIEFWCFMPLAFIFCISHCVVGILLVKIGGAGRHYPALLLEDPFKIITWLKLDKAEEYTYMMSITFPKLAILCLYLRIFSQKSYQTAAYATGVLIILTCVAGLLSSSLMCRPFAYHWDKSIPGGKCGNMMAGYRYIGIPNLLSDTIMLFLPLPAIYKLQVHLPVKIGLFITFVTGSFGIITSIIRMVEFFTIDLFSDPTFKCIPTMTWTIVEPGVYFMAACMPTLRPLKRKVFKDFSFTSMIGSSIGLLSKGRSTVRRSTKGSSHDGSRVLKTTDIKLESTWAVSETASTKSLDPKANGFVRMEEYHMPGRGPGGQV